MPWTTPTLKQVRQMTRDFVVVALGAKVMIPNSPLRIMSDAKANLAHMTLIYLDWLADQLLPDTAETEWLDRHGDIWLTNSDSTKGRKRASLASGTVTVTGTATMPANLTLNYGSATFTITDTAALSDDPTPVAVVATIAGIIGNVDPGEQLQFDSPPAGVDSYATVVNLTGGADDETDDELRARVLFRIQNPPMGGDKADYEIWATAVPGVTRAWAYANEQGAGSVTIRIMCDVTQAGNNGLPSSDDLTAVQVYIDSVRPVCLKDCFVEAPIPFFYDLTISGLVTDDASTRTRIETAIKDMEKIRMSPGATLYRSWLDEAISSAIGEDHHELGFTTLTMAGNGYLPTLGNITYA